jgi:prepilin-type N-terminal cleavage/methylation domain-containing protein
MTDYKEHKKKRNDGFTLVELIVVIVILAILAAILVPALLGYIDRAKKGKVYLNARNAMMATQAVLSQYYAAGTPLGELYSTGGTYVYTNDDPFAQEVLSIADPPEGYDFISFGCNANSVDTNGEIQREGYTLKFFLYSENNEQVYYYNGEWHDGAWQNDDELVRQSNYIYVIYDDLDAYISQKYTTTEAATVSE